VNRHAGRAPHAHVPFRVDPAKAAVVVRARRSVCGEACRLITRGDPRRPWARGAQCRVPGLELGRTVSTWRILADPTHPIEVECLD
jgi:hypothetical protein